MSIQAVKRPIESQPSPLDLIPEGPITNLPPEIVKCILFFTNHSESTRFVSHSWNDLTFKVLLEQTISLITKKLNPDTQAQCIADLDKLKNIHQPNNIAPCIAARRSFLTIKGLVIGILRNLPYSQRDQLQKAVGDQLPNSMRDLFKLSGLHLLTIDKNIDLEALYALILSYYALPKNNREEAGSCVIEINSIKFVKSQLAISIVRDDAVLGAAKNGNLQLVKLFLVDGSISEDARGKAIAEAAVNNNLKIVKLLLADGPISALFRGLAVSIAAKNNNQELVKLLLADGPIHGYYRYLAINDAIINNYLDLVGLLLADGPISEQHRESIFATADKQNNPELDRLLRERFAELIPQNYSMNFPSSFRYYIGDYS